jgi:hypothetical protein
MHAVAAITAVLVQHKVAAATDMVAGMVPPDSAPATAWQLNFGFILKAIISHANLAPQVHSGKASIFERAQKAWEWPGK